MTNWHDIPPKDAVNITLPKEGIWGPKNEVGEPCPWPWEPQQLAEAPLGQYRCPYCMAMVVAGVPHPDYSDWTNGNPPECECNGGSPCDCPDCDHADCAYQQPEHPDVEP